MYIKAVKLRTTCVCPLRGVEGEVIGVYTVKLIFVLCFTTWALRNIDHPGRDWGGG